MHEFSLCQSLLKESLKVAPAYFEKKQRNEIPLQGNLVISAITVRIGLFSGVDKHLLKRAFDAALHDVHRYWPTHRDDSLMSCDDVVFAPFTQLLVEEAPTAIYCQQCDQNFTIDKQQYRQHHLTCVNDKNHTTQLLSGDEMLLVNLKMHQEKHFSPLAHLFPNSRPARG